MIKAGIISCILHLGILLVVVNLAKIEVPQITDVGENIEVRIVSKDRGTLTNPMEGNAPENSKEDKAVENVRDKKEKDDSIKESITKEMPEKKAVVKKLPLEKTSKKEVINKKVVVRKEEEPEVVTKSVAVVSKQKIEKTENIEKSKEAVKIKTIEESEIAPEKKEKLMDEKMSQGTEASDSAEDQKKSGSASKDKTKGTQPGNNGEDLIKLSDGSVMAKHQGIKGLSYGFVSSPEPDYPSLARRLGYKGDMVVKVIMEFDSSGKLQSMRVIEEKDRFGFANEVEKAVRKWRLTPIKYNSIDVKMRFYKSFKFEKLN